MLEMPETPEMPEPASPPVPELVMPALLLLEDAAGTEPENPAELMLTCANCGAPMDERKCKLICRCGYFLSCSDYL